ncbi:unnamed protein product [Ostreobium quekettii]|uniref:Transmembrane protein n=1 Tax=Ostreobium quekettii TaxID=121088 RepID=A0A8S1J2S4_9CHLO|nr:unnamed protein product [Ostreobium quekettii]
MGPIWRKASPLNGHTLDSACNGTEDRSRGMFAEAPTRSSVLHGRVQIDRFHATTNAVCSILSVCFLLCAFRTFVVIVVFVSARIVKPLYTARKAKGRTCCA